MDSESIFVRSFSDKNGRIGKIRQDIPPSPLQRDFMQEGMKSIDLDYGGGRARGSCQGARRSPLVRLP
jgi:hypothetical protein